MSRQSKHTETEFGTMQVQIFVCEYCQTEIGEGTQNGWIQTQVYDSIGPGVSVWNTPKHFCSFAHLIDFYQAATPDQ